MIVIKPHTACVNCVAFSPDGNLLASGSEDAYVRVWNPQQLHTGRPVWEVAADSPDAQDSPAAQDSPGSDHVFEFVLESCGVSHLQFTPDGRLLLTSGWQTHLRAWDAATGRPRWQVLKPRGYGGVGALAVSRDGRFVAFAGGWIGLPERVFVADVPTHTVLRSLPGHADACGVLAVGAEGFVSGGADKLVKFWTWGGQRNYHTLVLRGIVRGLAFSPDGRRRAAAGGKTVMVWAMDPPPHKKGRAKPGQCRHFRGHTGQVQTLEFSPDGATLASSAHDGTIRLWDVASGQQLRAFAPGVGRLHGLAFAPDGLTLAFGSTAGHVGLLDVAG